MILQELQMRLKVSHVRSILNRIIYHLEKLSVC